MQNNTQKEYEKECVIFTRYLVGETPPPEVVQRYSRANEILFTEVPPQQDKSVLQFVLRHTWSLGYLDGASALFMKNNILRGKILVLISILEAHPDFTRYFIPGSVSRVSFFVKGGILAFSAFFKCGIGIILLPFAKRLG